MFVYIRALYFSIDVYKQINFVLKRNCILNSKTCIALNIDCQRQLNLCNILIAWISLFNSKADISQANCLSFVNLRITFCLIFLQNVAFDKFCKIYEMIMYKKPYSDLYYLSLIGQYFSFTVNRNVLFSISNRVLYDSLEVYR